MLVKQALQKNTIDFRLQCTNPFQGNRQQQKKHSIINKWLISCIVLQTYEFSVKVPGAEEALDSGGMEGTDLTAITTKQYKNLEPL